MSKMQRPCHIDNGSPSLSSKSFQVSLSLNANFLLIYRVRVFFFPLAFTATMSDNVSLAEQATCVDSESEDDWYTIDIFSHVQSELDENNVTHKQLFLYVTRADVNRRTFLQVHYVLRELGWYINEAEFPPQLLSISCVGC